MLAFTLAAVVPPAYAKDIKLLNVSYDPTRELYQEFNTAFARHWKEKTGDSVTIQRGIGDVLVSWENEAFLALKEFGADKFEIITPSLSILAEPPVAVVDRVAKKRGTEAVAKAYLEYLYSDEGQDIAGKNFYRPRSDKAAAKYASQFTNVKLITIDEVFGGWKKANHTHFEDGGVFDQIIKP